MISHKLQNSNTEVYCNCCGSKITNIEGKVIKKDYLHIEKKWGYFSQRDMEGHIFNICESCYNSWIKTFAIPVEPVEINSFAGDDVYIYTDNEIKELNNAYKREMDISINKY